MYSSTPDLFKMGTGCHRRSTDLCTTALKENYFRHFPAGKDSGLFTHVFFNESLCRMFCGSIYSSVHYFTLDVCVSTVAHACNYDCPVNSSKGYTMIPHFPGVGMHQLDMAI
jgi:hypothetical protein